jgi:hypothetical protein
MRIGTVYNAGNVQSVFMSPYVTTVIHTKFEFNFRNVKQ